MEKNEKPKKDDEETSLKNLKKARSKVFKQKKIELIKRAGDAPLLCFIFLTALWFSISSCLHLYYGQQHMLEELFARGQGASVIWSYAFIGVSLFLVVMVFGFWSLMLYEARILIRKRDKEKNKTYIDRLIE